MAIIHGWYKKRVGKEVRIATLYVNGMTRVVISGPMCVTIEADIEADPEINREHEHLAMYLTPKEARGLARQILEWAANAAIENKEDAR